MWEELLTNERKTKEKSKNSASKRHWWSIYGLTEQSTLAEWANFLRQSGT